MRRAFIVGVTFAMACVSACALASAFVSVFASVFALTACAPPVAKPSSQQSSSGATNDASMPSSSSSSKDKDGDAAPIAEAISDAGAAAAVVAPRVTFAPSDVGPMKQGRPDDGRFTPVDTNANAIGVGVGVGSGVGDAGAMQQEVEDSILWKTVLHPDPSHVGAELYVVAIDARRVELHSVAGAVDPEATTPAGKKAARPAIVPAERHGALLAAFNGGWKSEHGHYGMKTDGVLFVTPNPNDSACTVAAYEDDNSIRVAPWKDVSSSEPRMRFFRQTPACLAAGGVRHKGLSVEGTRNWGADQEGSPIIRRSAIGMDAKGTVLFVGVSNPMTAPALTNGMLHAGAQDVTELDVNWSFPKFLIFHPSPKSSSNAPSLDAQSLFPTFVFDKAEYVRRRSQKDFFYLVRRP